MYSHLVPLTSLCFLRAAFISSWSTSSCNVSEVLNTVKLCLVLTVQEYALAERARNSRSQLSISCLEDRLGALVENFFVELVVIHREASSREQVQESLVVAVRQVSSHVGKRSGIGHVDRDGMAMAKWHFRHQLMEW